MMSTWLRRWFVLLAVLPFGSGASAGEPESLGRWIAVVPPALHDALGPLIEHRTKQGFRVEVLDAAAHEGQTPAQLAEDLTQRLAKIRGEFDGPGCVLLVGDWQPQDGSPYLPPMTGVRGRMLGQPTDLPFALPDQEGAPRWAVGRCGRIWP